MLAQQQQQQQQEEYMRQQMALQEQQRQQEEWMRQQYLLQQQQQQQLMAQPTGYGSNNPFAPGGSQFQPQAQQQPSPQPTTSFLPVPVLPSPQQTQQPLEPQQTAKPFQAAIRKDDGQHSDLANLLARGREDGLDTFGNRGNLRESIRVNSFYTIVLIYLRYPRGLWLSCLESLGNPADWSRCPADRFRSEQPIWAGGPTAETERTAFFLDLTRLDILGGCFAYPAECGWAMHMYSLHYLAHI